MSDEGKKKKKAKVTIAEEVKVSSAEKAKVKLVRESKWIEDSLSISYVAIYISA